MKGYAVKSPDGTLVHVEVDESEEFTWAQFNAATDKGADEAEWKEQGYTCVPVTITEGEPKAVAKVGRSDVWHMPTLEWLPESGAMHIPKGALLFTHPPATLALLRKMYDLYRSDSTDNNTINEVEAALREAGE